MNTLDITITHNSIPYICPTANWGRSTSDNEKLLTKIKLNLLTPQNNSRKFSFTTSQAKNESITDLERLDASQNEKSKECSTLPMINSNGQNSLQENAKNEQCHNANLHNKKNQSYSDLQRVFMMANAKKKIKDLKQDFRMTSKPKSPQLKFGSNSKLESTKVRLLKTNPSQIAMKNYPKKLPPILSKPAPIKTNKMFASVVSINIDASQSLKKIQSVPVFLTFKKPVILVQKDQHSGEQLLEDDSEKEGTDNPNDAEFNHDQAINGDDQLKTLPGMQGTESSDFIESIEDDSQVDAIVQDVSAQLLKDTIPDQVTLKVQDKIPDTLQSNVADNETPKNQNLDVQKHNNDQEQSQLQLQSDPKEIIIPQKSIKSIFGNLSLARLEPLRSSDGSQKRPETPTLAKGPSKMSFGNFLAVDIPWAANKSQSHSHLLSQDKPKPKLLDNFKIEFKQEKPNQDKPDIANFMSGVAGFQSAFKTKIIDQVKQSLDIKVRKAVHYDKPIDNIFDIKVKNRKFARNRFRDKYSKAKPVPEEK